jgi:hypothetical protein
MNHTPLILILFSSIAGILLFAIWSNAYVYAQQTSSTSPSSSSMPSSPSVAKIKITSHTRGQQVPVGKDLTVSGTSIDNAASNYCKVSVIVNKVRPYQPATAIGPGGAADYSKWKFDITSKYTMIKPGQNRITAKYECGNNAALTSFSSVNVAGVQQAASAPKSTPTSTTGLTPTQSSSSTPLPNSKPIATTTATVSNASNKTSSSSVIAPQLNAINQQEHPPQLLPTTQVQNYTLSPTYSGMGSDKLMYLGYHHGSDSFTGKSGSSITTTKSDSSSNNHDNNGDSSSKITGDSNTETSNHNTGGATHVQSTGKTGTIKSEINSSHDSDSTITHDSSAGKNTTTTTVGSLSHSSPNDKKNSSDTKSSAHKNDSSKPNIDSSSTEKNTHTTKASSHHHTKPSAVTDNGSIGKSPSGSHTANNNIGSIDNGNSDPNFSTGINDGSIPLSSSDLALAIKNKVDSIIRNSIGGVIDKTPFLLPFH